MTAQRTRRSLWRCAQLLGGAAILAIIVWRLGTGPFVDGLRRVSLWSVAAAVAITAVTTVSSAWRWRVIACRLGAPLSFGAAVAGYYRSQFLNTALPGGVLGDVHRAVRHGRDVDDVGRGVRAVIWERSAGQVVQATVALIVLLAIPSPLRAAMPAVAAAAVLGAAATVVAGRALPRHGTSRWARTLRAVAFDLRDGLLARRAWPAIVTASLVVVAGHVATFVIAARTAGVTVSTFRLLPLAILVLLAMAVPTNIGGWGPREGVAAWVFAAAGLGAGQGVAAATVYGVLVLAAGLPGAALILIAWLQRDHRAGWVKTDAARQPIASSARKGGA